MDDALPDTADHEQSFVGCRGDDAKLSVHFLLFHYNYRLQVSVAASISRKICFMKIVVIRTEHQVILLLVLFQSWKTCKE